MKKSSPVSLSLSAGSPVTNDPSSVFHAFASVGSSPLAASFIALSHLAVSSALVPVSVLSAPALEPSASRNVCHASALPASGALLESAVAKSATLPAAPAVKIFCKPSTRFKAVNIETQTSGEDAFSLFAPSAIPPIVSPVPVAPAVFSVSVPIAPATSLTVPAKSPSTVGFKSPASLSISDLISLSLPAAVSSASMPPATVLMPSVKLSVCGVCSKPVAISPNAVSTPLASVTAPSRVFTLPATLSNAPFRLLASCVSSTAPVISPMPFTMLSLSCDTSFSICLTLPETPSSPCTSLPSVVTFSPVTSPLTALGTPLAPFAALPKSFIPCLTAPKSVVSASVVGLIDIPSPILPTFSGISDAPASAPSNASIAPCVLPISVIRSSAFGSVFSASAISPISPVIASFAFAACFRSSIAVSAALSPPASVPSGAVFSPPTISLTSDGIPLAPLTACSSPLTASRAAPKPPVSPFTSGVKLSPSATLFSVPAVSLLFAPLTTLVSFSTPPETVSIASRASVPVTSVLNALNNVPKLSGSFAASVTFPCKPLMLSVMPPMYFVTWSGVPKSLPKSRKLSSKLVALLAVYSISAIFCSVLRSISAISSSSVRGFSCVNAPSRLLIQPVASCTAGNSKLPKLALIFVMFVCNCRVMFANDVSAVRAKSPCASAVACIRY